MINLVIISRLYCISQHNIASENGHVQTGHKIHVPHAASWSAWECILVGLVTHLGVKETYVHYFINSKKNSISTLMVNSVREDLVLLKRMIED